MKVGIVGGSDLHKIAEQLGDNGEPADSLPSQPPQQHMWGTAYHLSACASQLHILAHLANLLVVINAYDYVFAENGLVAYKNGELIGKASLKTYLGEEKLKVSFQGLSTTSDMTAAPKCLT